jgi:hypothetical protein
METGYRRTWLEGLFWLWHMFTRYHSHFFSFLIRSSCSRDTNKLYCTIKQSKANNFDHLVRRLEKWHQRHPHTQICDPDSDPQTPTSASASAFASILICTLARATPKITQPATDTMKQTHPIIITSAERHTHTTHP